MKKSINFGGKNWERNGAIIRKKVEKNEGKIKKTIWKSCG